MELLQLKYFKDAAEMENFSKAAIKNMVPQPSISNAVKRLEEELDVKLFDRVGKKIFLNEEGRYLLEKATDILNSVDESTLHFENLQKCVINLYVQDAPFFSHIIWWILDIHILVFILIMCSLMRFYILQGFHMILLL